MEIEKRERKDEDSEQSEDSEVEGNSEQEDNETEQQEMKQVKSQNFKRNIWFFSEKEASKLDFGKNSSKGNREEEKGVEERRGQSRCGAQFQG